MLKIINKEELIKGYSIERNDILNYDNSYYHVIDGIQNCRICPLKPDCEKINCHDAFEIEFKQISEIEAMILTKGVI